MRCRRYDHRAVCVRFHSGIPGHSHTSTRSRVARAPLVRWPPGYRLALLVFKVTSWHVAITILVIATARRPPARVSRFRAFAHDSGVWPACLRLPLFGCCSYRASARFTCLLPFAGLNRVCQKNHRNLVRLKKTFKTALPK